MEAERVLRLRNRLARVARDVDGRRGIAVGRVLGRRERAGVERRRHLGFHRAQLESRRRSRRVVEREVGLLDVRVAELAESVERGAREEERGHRVADAARRPRLHLRHAERAARHAQGFIDGIRRRHVAGHGDDPAGAIAVERRGRPAEHLHARDVAEVDVVELILPVGKGLRHAVEQDLHAADAEVGARARAANRETLVQRVVVTRRDVHAGDIGQRLVDPERRLATRDLILILDAHGPEGARCADSSVRVTVTWTPTSCWTRLESVRALSRAGATRREVSACAWSAGAAAQRKTATSQRGESLERGPARRIIREE